MFFWKAESDLEIEWFHNSSIYVFLFQYQEKRYRIQSLVVTECI